MYGEKDRKQFVLKALHSVVFHKECKSDEKRGQDRENELPSNVDGATVVVLKCANSNSFELRPERHCEFAFVVESIGRRLNIGQTCMDLVNLGHGLLSFRAG